MQPQIKECDSLSISIDIDAIIGVNAHERISPQMLKFILTIFSRVILSKSEVEKRLGSLIKEYTEHNQPQLLETMAHGLSLKLSPWFDDFILTIEKPQAIKEARCAYTSIRVHKG